MKVEEEGFIFEFKDFPWDDDCGGAVDNMADTEVIGDLGICGFGGGYATTWTMLGAIGKASLVIVTSRELGVNRGVGRIFCQIIAGTSPSMFR